MNKSSNFRITGEKRLHFIVLRVSPCVLDFCQQGISKLRAERVTRDTNLLNRWFPQISETTHFRCVNVAMLAHKCSNFRRINIATVDVQL